MGTEAPRVWYLSLLSSSEGKMHDACRAMRVSVRRVSDQWREHAGSTRVCFGTRRAPRLATKLRRVI